MGQRYSRRQSKEAFKFRNRRDRHGARVADHQGRGLFWLGLAAQSAGRWLRRQGVTEMLKTPSTILMVTAAMLAAPVEVHAGLTYFSENWAK